MSFGDTNYIRVTRIKEATWGTTPASGNSTELRITGQTMNSNNRYIRSEEINQDRMTSDTILVDAEPAGDIPVEMSFGNADDLIEAALFSNFVTLPYKINLTADSSITGVTDSSDTFTVDAGGTSFKAGHLVQSSGFGNAANDLVFAVASSTGTTVVGSGLTLTDETAPPVGATLRVVGLIGGSGDIVATTTGLTSTTTDFVSLGVVKGAWLKLGGTGAGNRFATSANNGWCRVATVTANAIVFDVKPADWAADAGTGKTIKIWFGDILKNGKVRQSFTFEREHTDLTQFFSFRGMMVNTASLSLATGAILTGTFSLMGKDGDRGTATVMPGTVQDAPTGDVMNSVRDVVNILEGGSNAGTIQNLTVNITNNLRGQKAIGFLGNAGIGVGDFEVTFDFTAYFENGNLYDKYDNGTETSLAFTVAQDGQGYVFDAPRVKIETCTVQAGQRNTDCTLQATARALRYRDLSAQFIIQRFHYFED